MEWQFCRRFITVQFFSFWLRYPLQVQTGSKLNHICPNHPPLSLRRSKLLLFTKIKKINLDDNDHYYVKVFQSKVGCLLCNVLYFYINNAFCSLTRQTYKIFKEQMLLDERNLDRRNQTSILITFRRRKLPFPLNVADRKTYGLTFVIIERPCY